MKILGALLIFNFAFAVGPEAVQKAQGPRIVSVIGQAQAMVAREVAFGKASTALLLVEKAHFRTGADGLVRVRVSPNLELEILQESEVLLPGISWESGQVPVVQLIQGQVRWIQTTEATSQLKTAIYELNPTAGEFIFSMDPKVAEAGVKTLKGEISFKAMNAETAVSVGAGQKVRFIGAIEEGEIAYDILLQGKKIPRGTLGKVEALTDAEKNPFVESEKKILRQKEAASKAEKERIARNRRERVICDKPGGRFNECAWVCENNLKGSRKCQTGRAQTTCYRVRCNANGVWADRLNLPAAEGSRRCQAQPVVAACDY